MEGYTIYEMDMTKLTNAVLATGKKIGLELEPITTEKNNLTKVGFVIRNMGVYCPTIYIDNIESKSPDEIITEIKSMLNNLPATPDVDVIVDKIKKHQVTPDMLKRRVVSHTGNEKLLANKLHRPFLDLAIYYAICEGELSVPVTDALAVSNGWSEEELFQLTAKEDGYLYGSMLDVLMKKSTPIEISDEMEPVTEAEAMYVLLSKSGTFGASALTHSHVLKNLARAFGKINLFILPSSVHELIILPEANGISPEELLTMVKEVNSTVVADEEKLSDSVYRYVYNEDRVELVASTVYVDVDKKEVSQYE